MRLLGYMICWHVSDKSVLSSDEIRAKMRALGAVPTPMLREFDTSRVERFYDHLLGNMPRATPFGSQRISTFLGRVVREACRGLLFKNNTFYISVGGMKTFKHVQNTLQGMLRAANKPVIEFSMMEIYGDETMGNRGAYQLVAKEAHAMVKDLSEKIHKDFQREIPPSVARLKLRQHEITDAMIILEFFKEELGTHFSSYVNKLNEESDRLLRAFPEKKRNRLAEPAKLAG